MEGLAKNWSANDPASASPGEPAKAQFGPHRFYGGEGGGSEQFRGARFDVADLRGARFTDCDMTGVTIRDCWLVDVSISGYLSNVTVNGVDVTDFVSAELDRCHPERVQFREAQTADDVRAMWDTIERLWAQASQLDDQPAGWPRGSPAPPSSKSAAGAKVACTCSPAARVGKPTAD
jgi:uncharacterized protein YjbI with pentapeptide repeats